MLSYTLEKYEDSDGNVFYEIIDPDGGQVGMVFDETVVDALKNTVVGEDGGKKNERLYQLIVTPVGKKETNRTDQYCTTLPRPKAVKYMESLLQYLSKASIAHEIVKSLEEDDGSLAIIDITLHGYMAMQIGLTEINRGSDPQYVLKQTTDKIDLHTDYHAFDPE